MTPAGQGSPAWSINSAVSWGLTSSKPSGATATASHQNNRTAPTRKIRSGAVCYISINLKDFYYWYIQDQFIEVSEEVAEALRASVRYEAAYQRRLTRHKAQYPLDCEDGIEYSACLHELPRKFWSSRSGLSVFGTPSTPCRKSRAAGSMPTSFLAKALKRLPRPRVCMRSPSASLSSGAWNA